MSQDNVNRRGFLKNSAFAAGAGLVLSLEEKALASPLQNPNTTPASAKFPSGKIKDMQVSRLICGGNLISGFAHARDLIYVSSLLKQYFTDEKVCETLGICEDQGINTAILRVDQNTIRILNKYWGDWGGAIQWIAQAKMPSKNFKRDIDMAAENGAKAIYIHGGQGDSFVENGEIDKVAKAVEYIQELGCIGGVAGHKIATIKGYVDAGVPVDFYMKTINSKKYWSAEATPGHWDAVWADTPEETIAYMQSIDKPWIGYKVLGAGAIKPDEGFKFAWENGADFICAGMFDFQIAEDAIIAKRILNGELQRKRPWCS